MLLPQAPNAFLQCCLSHTLTHIGDKTEFVTVNDFVAPLTTKAFSTNARACFKQHGQTMVRFQNVRWYVKYDRAR